MAYLTRGIMQDGWTPRADPGVAEAQAWQQLQLQRQQQAQAAQQADWARALSEKRLGMEQQDMLQKAEQFTLGQALARELAQLQDTGATKRTSMTNAAQAGMQARGIAAGSREADKSREFQSVESARGADRAMAMAKLQRLWQSSDNAQREALQRDLARQGIDVQRELAQGGWANAQVLADMQIGAQQREGEANRSQRASMFNQEATNRKEEAKAQREWEEGRDTTRFGQQKELAQLQANLGQRIDVMDRLFALQEALAVAPTPEAKALIRAQIEHLMSRLSDDPGGGAAMQGMPGAVPASGMASGLARSLGPALLGQDQAAAGRRFLDVFFNPIGGGLSLGTQAAADQFFGMIEPILQGVAGHAWAMPRLKPQR